MKWYIPAKTFLVGEYLALNGGPALLLNTTPLFSLMLTSSPQLEGISLESPAGKWWLSQGLKKQGLKWEDPYSAKGGLGASSAQFVGAFIAYHHLMKKQFTLDDLLREYYSHAWNGVGVKPSGYDVIAQTKNKAAIYIERNTNTLCEWNWPFSDLGFFIIHTGKKLATHNHLEKFNLSDRIQTLKETALLAKEAFETKDSLKLLKSVNTYYEQLLSLELVAPHTKKLIEDLQKIPEVLATKGCGALGADTVILFAEQKKMPSLNQELQCLGLEIIATQSSLL